MTHVEANLGDVNRGDESGASTMRCMMEAQVVGVKNIAVKHQAESLHLTIEGAADKLKKGLDSTLCTLQDRQRRRPGMDELGAEVVCGSNEDLPPPSFAAPHSRTLA